MSVLQGFGRPSRFERLALAIRSIEIHSQAPRRKLPVTYEMLFKVRSKLSNSYDDTLMWAVMTLAHFALLRASEFTIAQNFNSEMHLCLKDIKMCKLSIPTTAVLIKRSKTDHFNAGFNAYLGCTETEVCSFRVYSPFGRLTWS